MTGLRPDGEVRDFPYRNVVRAPLGLRDRKYVYGRTREKVHHGRWGWEAQREKPPADRLVSPRMPTIGQPIHRWLEGDGCSKSCPADIRDV